LEFHQKKNEKKNEDDEDLAEVKTVERDSFGPKGFFLTEADYGTTNRGRRKFNSDVINDVEEESRKN